MRGNEGKEGKSLILRAKADRIDIRAESHVPCKSAKAMDGDVYFSKLYIRVTLLSWNLFLSARNRQQHPPQPSLL